MQLNRDTLHKAALALLLVPVAAKADDATNRIDVTSLLYNEQSRTNVVEPVVRFTHLLPDGQSFSAQLGIDVITGASPTGALPSGTIQTRTSASGHTITTSAGAIPTAAFTDRRLALDGEWHKPLGRFVASDLSGHLSREKDYQSLGVGAKFSWDVMNRLVTLTAGGAVNHDTVFPTGGTPLGLTTGTIVSHAANAKDVKNFFAGASRIMTRRWMMSVEGSRTMENGYLTEPYKVVSIMNRTTGVPIQQLTDMRPSTRNRTAVLVSSVYHYTNDVLYSSYRYYTDTWAVHSHTLDLKYRHQISDDTYLEPLLRYYTQSAESFYNVGLMQGAPLPSYATSDYRLGRLHTITLGGTYGFHFEDSPGDWTVRAQLMRQSGDSSPPNVVGIQRRYDLVPPVNIFAIAIGYSFGY